MEACPMGRISSVPAGDFELAAAGEWGAGVGPGFFGIAFPSRISGSYGYTRPADSQIFRRSVNARFAERIRCSGTKQVRFDVSFGSNAAVSVRRQRAKTRLSRFPGSRHSVDA
jgi:hypothetical protein